MTHRTTGYFGLEGLKVIESYPPAMTRDNALVSSLYLFNDQYLTNKFQHHSSQYAPSVSQNDLRFILHFLHSIRLAFLSIKNTLLKDLHSKCHKSKVFIKG